MAAVDDVDELTE